MNLQRSLRQRLAPVGRAFLFFLFVILVTASGVICACEVAVRYPDGFTLSSKVFDGRQQALFAFETLVFAALYGFALRRNWRRTLRISVGMLGLVMAFLSIAFYGFWLSRPNAELQVAGRNTALASAVAFLVFLFWSGAVRRKAGCRRGGAGNDVISSDQVVKLSLAAELINHEVKG
ncbi:hypothetical protein AB4Y45_32200 [Paraburkholderia sp. EG287A]|uniref:hypothetical protein n=1 Tax=Paraburkholderia sp. EG287A TaxID=3237012 RepID=UPI0034D2EF92